MSPQMASMAPSITSSCHVTVPKAVSTGWRGGGGGKHTLLASFPFGKRTNIFPEIPADMVPYISLAEIGSPGQLWPQEGLRGKKGAFPCFIPVPSGKGPGSVSSPILGTQELLEVAELKVEDLPA